MLPAVGGWVYTLRGAGSETKTRLKRHMAKPIWNKSWPNFPKDKGTSRDGVWAALPVPPKPQRFGRNWPGQLTEIGQSKV